MTARAKVQPPATKSAAGLYERDLYAWTREQAQLLREQRFDELDLSNLIDEVESVGGSEKREIRNRLAILLAHLLKWRFQPGARSNGWRGTIRDQRKEIEAILEDSPSLRAYPGQVLARCYLSGHLRASEETGIDFTLFPDECPFTIEQVLDPDFLPKEVGLYNQS
ncbi:MAG: DUF29 domain-containing protein [Bauldia sp.]|nr:DUF29 domain-containing protein [Bauldia sp.]